MARSKFSMFTVLVILMAVSFQEALALTCWHCNSIDEPEYCGDPFLGKEILTEDQQKGRLTKCEIANSGTPVCLKMISKQNDKEFIRRICQSTRIAADSACKANGAGTVCEICESDECNSATKYSPIAILIVLPLAIVKFLFY